tara:strand:+ start:815 stop:2047 length:1233 start_codon:yes stop_codon:yes gene_type:complete
MESTPAIVVMKFGGSSLADTDKISVAARKIEESINAGYSPVVAVSAMGNTTDILLQMAKELGGRPRERDLDLLLSTGEVVSCALMSIALNRMGYSSEALTGPAAGISTDGRYGKARIEYVAPGKLIDLIHNNVVPVVAGFQGLSSKGEITTLGRGASDTTAVSLAAALQAKACIIHTDVEGIYSADPRIVPKARKLKQITYEETLEMASLGAKVMHPRSVEAAQRHNVEVIVKSTFSSAEGSSLVSSNNIDIETGRKVRAVVHDADVGQITIHNVPDRPGLASALFQPLADAAVSVDVIVQNVGRKDATDLSFSVSSDDLEPAFTIVQKVADKVGAQGVSKNDRLGKLSIVGVGMASAPGVAANMFSVLGENDINITSITTSEIRVTCLIDRDQLEEGAKLLHTAFDLDD